MARRRGSRLRVPDIPVPPGGVVAAKLRAAITAYVDAHNFEGKPFKWTKTADEILDKMRRFGRRTQKAHGDLVKK